MKVTQLCLTLCDPMDYRVHGILQTRILEWVAYPFSRGSSQPRDWTQVSCIEGESLPVEQQRNVKNTGAGILSLLHQTGASYIVDGFFTNWAMREAQNIRTKKGNSVHETNPVQTEFKVYRNGTLIKKVKVFYYPHKFHSIDYFYKMFQCGKIFTR